MPRPLTVAALALRTQMLRSGMSEPAYPCASRLAQASATDWRTSSRVPSALPPRKKGTL